MLVLLILNEHQAPLQGIRGIQGVQGPTGASGGDGTGSGQGPQGVQGIAGVKRDKGDTGSVGPQGLKGDTGNSCKHIINNVATTYPSVNQPVHLMPHSIVNASSLNTSNSLGEYKNAISLITEIDTKTYLPIDSTSILFTKVLVKPENSFTYEKASEYLIDHNKFIIFFQV